MTALGTPPQTSETERREELTCVVCGIEMIVEYCEDCGGEGSMPMESDMPLDMNLMCPTCNGDGSVFWCQTPGCGEVLWTARGPE